jgi:hypothetical protein
VSHVGIYGVIYEAGRKVGRIDLDTFGFEKIAVGGCWAASLSLSLNLQRAEDWYENGLAREIKFFDNEGAWIWEGIVNKVTLNAGDISEVRGPLLDIANRVTVTYTPRDFSVYPPVDGSQTSTTITENEYSQQLYGIIEQVISAGTCPDDTAIKVQTQYLQENAIPKTSGEVSITPGSSQAPVVSLELIGKVQFMARYIYDSTSNGLSYLSDKLIAILGYDPNSYILANYSWIEENQYLVNDLEDKLRFAWDIVSELLTLGNDTDDNRRLFGIYENGRPVYNTMPNEIDYIYRISSNQEIRNYKITSEIIRPWRVQPGKWINVADFLIGRNIFSTSLYGDPRNHFIESVKYTAPYTINLSGGSISRLSQMLAKITYTGGIY